jgi:hypothetical protein
LFIKIFKITYKKEEKKTEKRNIHRCNHGVLQAVKCILGLLLLMKPNESVDGKNGDKDTKRCPIAGELQTRGLQLQS